MVARAEDSPGGSGTRRLVIDCCYFADADGVHGDCEPCPTCKEIVPIIEVCADLDCGDTDGNSCTCADEVVFQ
jgi:hypothetical protein